MTVNSKLFALLIGVIIGMAYPLALDYLLFNTITPCSTVTVFEDGSSIQKCEVKE